jgi:outer membrane receptor protein involved in Fe transport
LLAVAAGAQTPATLTVQVQSESRPVPGAAVAVGTQTVETDDLGRAAVPVPAGVVTIVVKKAGFVDAQETVTVAGGASGVSIELVPLPALEEEVVVVATTRTGRRVEDQPTRVEVLGREEVEEKMLMTPGDIVMMLNEMGGLRVQATSPSIGAASVRVQGIKGRYTRFLTDGLPLFGQQVGGLGLLQIPPMDLAQVEVIKGVASALYGAGAMGGVVNLLTRRPGDTPAADLLVNRSTLGGTDAVAFLAAPIAADWRLSLLAGGHRQPLTDRDDDGWADVAGYGRGVVRPRFFWDDGDGRSAFLTAGVTLENRDGGTLAGASLSAVGGPYVEALDTRRYDAGGTVQTLVRERYVLTARGAAAWQRHLGTDFGAASVTATVFGSSIADPAAVDRDSRYVLFNRGDATTNVGGELLGTVRRGPWAATGTYTYVRAREDGEGGRQDVALTPRHSAGLVGMWEEEDWGRLGLEVYYTGPQRLEGNPYRTTSVPYVIVGALIEKRIGVARIFVNAENLTNVRQTRWDSLLRSSRGADGRWTVDAWAPIDGRAINGGVRLGL